jgi:hypothetical protein
VYKKLNEERGKDFIHTDYHNTNWIVKNLEEEQSVRHCTTSKNILEVQINTSKHKGQRNSAIYASPNALFGRHLVDFV